MTTHTTSYTTVEPTVETTSQTTGRRVASLGELQRAWEAVQSGRFRTSGRPGTTGASSAAGEWFPTETVIPVIGAGGGVGATSLALALASVSPIPARVVECCSASASGLAAASTAELGATETGWRQGLREGEHHRILLERASGSIPAATDVPAPTDPDPRIAVTFLDCGWDLDHLMTGGWLAETVTGAAAVVVATTATIPGLRRLEITLDTLGLDPAEGRVVAGVLGPLRKKWGRQVEGSLGALTRSLAAAEDLVEIPLDRNLATCGLSSAPLPQPLLTAASQLLERLPTTATAARAMPGRDVPGLSADHELLAVDDDQAR